MTTKADRITDIVQFVNQQGEPVSVHEIRTGAFNGEITHDYTRRLAIEARDQQHIEGHKSVPITGYDFTGDGTIDEVPTSRAESLRVIERWAPHRLGAAERMNDDHLRGLIETLSEDSRPVDFAWRFYRRN